MLVFRGFQVLWPFTSMTSRSSSSSWRRLKDLKDVLFCPLLLVLQQVWSGMDTGENKPLTVESRSLAMNKRRRLPRLETLIDVTRVTVQRGQNAPSRNPSEGGTSISMIRAVCLTVSLLVAAVVGAPPGRADSFNELWDKMPYGYTSDSCSRVPPAGISPGGIVAINCSGGQLPDGTYQLFKDKSSLANEFQSILNHYYGKPNLRPCTGGLPSPSPWHRPETPTVVRGQIACSLGADEVALIWTRDEDLFSGEVWGPDIPTLYEWWTKHGMIAHT